MKYEELRRRLLPEALALFNNMAKAHLAAKGDRRFILVLTGSGAQLLFIGGPFSAPDLDPGTLDDLARHQLLGRSRSSRDVNYRVTSEGILFHRWLMNEQGQPLQQVERLAVSLLDSPGFAAAHPSVAHHLGAAFDLVWAGDMSEATVSEIGAHLRSSLFDVVADTVPGSGADYPREKPVEALKDWIRSHNQFAERESRALAALVDLLEAVLILDQRVDHARDEADKGFAVENWEEVRRAAFLTAVCCYEIHAIG